MDEEKKTAVPETETAKPETQASSPEAKTVKPETPETATVKPETQTSAPEAKPAKPKKWKKWLLRSTIGLVVLLVALVIFLWLLLDWTVASTVRNVAPMFTGTPVELKSVSIGIFSGRVELKGFKVANPAGFAHPYAFELDSFVCEADIPSALTDKIIVKEVTIKGMLADYEPSMKGSNLAQIQKNVESAIGQSDGKSADADAKPAEEGKEKEKAGKQVVIRELSVSGIKLASGAIKLPLPPIKLNNLGENTLGEVIDKFYVALMKSVGDAISSKAVQGIGDAVSDAGKSIGGGIKKLFDSKK